MDDSFKEGLPPRSRSFEETLELERELTRREKQRQDHELELIRIAREEKSLAEWNRAWIWAGVICGLGLVAFFVMMVLFGTGVLKPLPPPH